MPNDQAVKKINGAQRKYPRFKSVFQVPIALHQDGLEDYVSALIRADKSDVIKACHQVLRKKSKAKR